jgi:hypothetical protein
VRSEFAAAARGMAPLEPPIRSTLLDKTAAFLSKLTASNADLAGAAPTSSTLVSIKPVNDQGACTDSDGDQDDDAPPHVEMDIACGVLDLQNKAAEAAATALLADNVGLSDSDTTSETDDDFLTTPTTEVHVCMQAKTHHPECMAQTRKEKNDGETSGTHRQVGKSCMQGKLESLASHKCNQPGKRPCSHISVAVDATAASNALGTAEPAQFQEHRKALIEEIPDGARPLCERCTSVEDTVTRIGT